MEVREVKFNPPIPTPSYSTSHITQPIPIPCASHRREVEEGYSVSMDVTYGSQGNVAARACV